MAGFLEELAGAARNDDVLENLRQKVQEHVDSGIDNQVRNTCKHIKEDIKKRAKAGEYRQVGEKRYIEGRADGLAQEHQFHTLLCGMAGELNQKNAWHVIPYRSDAEAVYEGKEYRYKAWREKARRVTSMAKKEARTKKRGGDWLFQVGGFLFCCLTVTLAVIWLVGALFKKNWRFWSPYWYSKSKARKVEIDIQLSAPAQEYIKRLCALLRQEQIEVKKMEMVYGGCLPPQEYVTTITSPDDVATFVLEYDEYGKLIDNGNRCKKLRSNASTSISIIYSVAF